MQRLERPSNSAHEMLIHFKGQAELRMSDTSPGFIGIIAFMHPSFKMMFQPDSYMIFYASIRDHIGSHHYVWNLKSCGKGAIHCPNWLMQTTPKGQCEVFPTPSFKPTTSSRANDIANSTCMLHDWCIHVCTFTWRSAISIRVVQIIPGHSTQTLTNRIFSLCISVCRSIEFQVTC